MPGEAGELGDGKACPQQSTLPLQPYRGRPEKADSAGDAQQATTTISVVTVRAADKNRGETYAEQNVRGVRPLHSPTAPHDPAASRMGVAAGVCPTMHSSEGSKSISQPVELKSEDLQVIRVFLQKFRAQREQQGPAKSQNASTPGGHPSVGEPCQAGRAADQPTQPSSEDADTSHLADEAYLQDTLQRLQCAHVPVPEILKGHPKSLGMLIKSLQVTRPHEKRGMMAC